MHLRSLTIEPLAAHRIACGGAPARQSDRQVRGAVSPSRTELGSDWSSWGGVSSSEGPDLLCPTLDALTSTAQILISYSGSARGADTVRSHPSAFVRGPKRPVTRMRVQIRVSGRSARKSQWKGHEPRSGTRGALLRLTRSALGALLRDFLGTGPWTDGLVWPTVWGPAGRRYDGGHAESPSMSVPYADSFPAWAEALFG